MLRVSLTEAYEAQLKEKDSDLKVLRREMLQAVTSFSAEKQKLEKVLQQKEGEWLEERVRNLQMHSNIMPQ